MCLFHIVSETDGKMVEKANFSARVFYTITEGFRLEFCNGILVEGKGSHT